MKSTNRRTFVKGMGAVVVGAVGLPGCGGDEGSEATQSAPKGREVIAGPVRTRKSIDALSREELDLYARAIRAMRALEPGNAHSLAAQALIHGTRCEHESWRFLPWHRPYLSFFEEAVRAVTGVESFALPYWDWSVSQKIPTAFSDASSPLYDATRSSRSLKADSVGPVGIERFLGITHWESFMGDNPGMSGIEWMPHGYVHVEVGGNMSGFGTAGLDPLFWTHHCNVDRLWESWARTYGITKHPNDQKNAIWAATSLSGFWDRKRNAAATTIADAISTRNFSYTYDKIYTRRVSKPTAKVISLNEVPQSGILTARSGSGGVSSFAVTPSQASQIAALANGTGIALARGATTPANASLLVQGISLVVTLPNQLSPGEVLVVKSAATGATLLTHSTFGRRGGTSGHGAGAHGVPKICLSLTDRASALTVRKGKLDIVIEINSKTVANVATSLFLA